MRLEEARELHLRGEHVAFEILYVVRKIEIVEFGDGELFAQEVATIRHTIQKKKKKQTGKYLFRLNRSKGLVKHKKITFIHSYFTLDRTRTQLLKSPVY